MLSSANGREKTHAVDNEGEDAHAICTDGVIEDFRRAKLKEWCPSELVGALEEQDCCYGGIDA